MDLIYGIRGQMNSYLSVFQVFTVLLAEKSRPRYDARLQLFAYQVSMLRSRIDDSRIYTTPEVRAELIRLGELLDHDISDVMLIVQPSTYHRWRKPKAPGNHQPPDSYELAPYGLLDHRFRSRFYAGGKSRVKLMAHP